MNSCQSHTGFEQHLSLPPSGSEDVSLFIMQCQFTQIVEKWSGHLQHTAFQITKNKQVTEDIVQEAFLELWKHRNRIIPGNPVGWLSKAVTNLALKHVRRSNVQLRVYKTLIHENKSCYSNVEERLIGKEKEILLNHAISKLPSQQQLVLQLSKETGLRRQEIAAHLQISPNTVKVHLLRAMQFVKEHICFICLFSIFCACNNLFFKSSNTVEGSRDLYKGEQVINTTETEDWISLAQISYATMKKNISQAVTVSLNQ